LPRRRALINAPVTLIAWVPGKEVLKGPGRQSARVRELLAKAAARHQVAELLVFGGVRAPSTLGSRLRSYTWGNVRQLDKAHRGLTAALAEDPRLLPGRGELAFIDIDCVQERVYGYKKEGAAFGHAKVQGKSLLLKGLNPLISIISTPLAALVLGPVRLRGGSTGSARGAAGLAAEAIGTAREASTSMPSPGGVTPAQRRHDIASQLSVVGRVLDIGGSRARTRTSPAGRTAQRASRLLCSYRLTFAAAGSEFGHEQRDEVTEDPHSCHLIAARRRAVT